MRKWHILRWDVSKMAACLTPLEKEITHCSFFTAPRRAAWPSGCTVRAAAPHPPGKDEARENSWQLSTESINITIYLYANTLKRLKYAAFLTNPTPLPVMLSMVSLSSLSAVLWNNLMCCTSCILTMHSEYLPEEGLGKVFQCVCNVCSGGHRVNIVLHTVVILLQVSYLRGN